MQNPFTYTFGIKPKEYIRHPQMDAVIRNFSYADPVERAFMITGVRGSGKTVMLADISEQIGRSDEWIVTDLNPSRDLLVSFGAQLYAIPRMKKQFAGLKIDLSLFGVGITTEKGTEIFDIETAIEKMLQSLSKSGKKVLITIDEAAPSKEMRTFCLSFQKMLRKRLPVYMVMTGLYHNIHNLKNMDGCTFLQRTPFIVLEPMDPGAIAAHYKKVFKIGNDEAKALASQTGGYAFAFQVLGKLYFEKKAKDTLQDIIPEYENELVVYSYNKIWSELSDKDRFILVRLASLSPSGSVTRKQLMEKTKLTSSMMNRYQARLKEKGVLSATEKGYGRYSFALPRFGDFILEYHADE